MPHPWFTVEQPDPRFVGQGRRLVGPFYKARVLDTTTGQYLILYGGGAPLTGLASVERAVRLGIQHHLRRAPGR